MVRFALLAGLLATVGCGVTFTRDPPPAVVVPQLVEFPGFKDRSDCRKLYRWLDKLRCRSYFRP